MNISNTDLGKFLRTIRGNLGYSTYDVNKLCNISPSYLSLIETGKRKPSATILKKLAPIYNIDYIDLYEKGGYIDLVKDKKIFKQQLEKPDEFKKTITQIPLLTTVKAGYNYMARENWEDMIEVDKNIIKDSSSYFALKIKDDSMSPILIKDDIVIIKKQQYFENGDLVVSIINKDEAIIRKGKKAKNTVLFQPLNNSYESLIFTYNEMKIIPITIVGIVKQLKRNF